MENLDAVEPEGASLGTVIANIRAFTEEVKICPRELLPNIVKAQMGHVDKLVEEFANEASISSWTNDSALQMLEQWQEKRSEIAEWADQKESHLQTRKDQIKTEEQKLKDAKKTLENLSSQEIEIRQRINEQHRKRGDLEAGRAEIEQQIAQLQESKELIISEFADSKEKSEELQKELELVSSEIQNHDSEIVNLESGLQEMAEDDHLNAEQDQHDQFLSWKENVEAVMNEIQKTRELKWKTWGPEEILDWICRLDHGTFRVYKGKLEEEVPAKIDTGVDLLYLLRDRQIIRELGVTKIRHRDMLIQHIERLNRNSPLRKQSHKGANPNV